MVISQKLNALLTLPLVARINSTDSKYRQLISSAFIEHIAVWLYHRPLALREQITDSNTIDRQYTRSHKPLIKVHAHVYSGTRGFNVRMSLHLQPHIVYASKSRGLSFHLQPHFVCASKPRGYKTFFRLNSTEHDMSTDHKN